MIGPYKYPAVFFFVINLGLTIFGCSGSKKPEPQSVKTAHEQPLHLPNEQLFGAEIQYFRLRGGPGRNASRQKVLEVWNRVLDRVNEAKMNTVSFYIPWDFHEYAEGRYDFDGQADEDGDGRPDYPARDLKTFIRLVREHGIQHIVVRPGPHINAEWGFLGFGAIPKWFHEKYPDAHAKTSNGLSSRVYDYHSPDLLRHTRAWFKTLYNEVLKDHVGPNRPIQFVQLDNETNFMWGSHHQVDYSPRNIARYQRFLKQRYSTLNAVNRAQATSWLHWEEIRPPFTPGLNNRQDQDWYNYADQSVADFLAILRTYWEEIGLREPTITFTIADSYNVNPKATPMLLPNYQLHNSHGQTGLMTVNLYPKVFERPERPLFNDHFKVDHDVKAAVSASEYYLGKGQHWAMGPEVQGGWWEGVQIRPEARRQTYLSALGHGLKAMIVYYFHEGYQYDNNWSRRQIHEIFDQKKSEQPFRDVSTANLPDFFWTDLQDRVEKKLMHGILAKGIMLNTDPVTQSMLYFDAPLDCEGYPRKHFEEIKRMGEQIISPHARWLGQAEALTDPVCILHDDVQHAPSPIAEIESGALNSRGASSLTGLALLAGANPRIIHWDLGQTEELRKCRVIIHQDNGISSPGLAQELSSRMADGATVVNFLDDSLARELGQNFEKNLQLHEGPTSLSFASGARFTSPPPYGYYNIHPGSGCFPVLLDNEKTVGYRCHLGEGRFYQISSPFYFASNDDDYPSTPDISQRAEVLKYIFNEQHLQPEVHVGGENDHLVAFARQAPDDPRIWVTVKSGRLGTTDSNANLMVKGILPHTSYKITDLSSGRILFMDGELIRQKGFPIKLPELGSTVFWLEPANSLTVSN